MSDAGTYCRVYIQDEDAFDVDEKHVDELRMAMALYVNDKRDAVMELVSMEGATVVFLISRVTGLFVFTPEARRKYQEQKYKLHMEIKDIQMELGGPDWVEHNE